jgi:type II secretory pathway pseudopilin PulG
MAISSRWTYFERADMKGAKAAPTVPDDDYIAPQVVQASQQQQQQQQQEFSQQQQQHVEQQQQQQATDAHQERHPVPAPTPEGNNPSITISHAVEERKTYNIENIDLTSRFEQLNGNCPGNVLGDEQDLTLAECAKACLQTPTCNGFTFNVQRQTRPYQCVLKSRSCSDPAGINGQWRFFARRASLSQPQQQQQPNNKPQSQHSMRRK